MTRASVKAVPVGRGARGKASKKAGVKVLPVKAIKKATKTSTRKTVVKRAAANGKRDGAKLLELGLLCDCTGSMCSWIDRARKTLQEIINNVIATCDGLKVRVCFIGYRDHCDKKRFSIHSFTENIPEIKEFISKV